jgi:glycosyltransferase involved in cell wall biosynthesis
VIIPYYNNRETIVRALQSVSQQTLNPIQVIVIDDGCHDATLIHLANDFGFQLIKLDQNSGSAVAKTEGARHAIGSHVALLDSDDAWIPNHLEIHQKLWLQLNKNVAAVSTNMSIESDSLEQNEFEPLIDVFQNPHKVSPVSLMFSNPLWNSTTTLNLSILKSVNYWINTPLAYAEDYDLLVKYVSRGHDLAKSRTVTGKYYPQSESKSTEITKVFASRILNALNVLSSLEINMYKKHVLKKMLEMYLWVSYTLSFAKSDQQYQEFLYPQVGNSALIKAINPVLRNSTVWLITRKTLTRTSYLSPRKGMRRG